MATYKVVGVGQHGKYFDDRAYQDVVDYIVNPEKTKYTGGAGVSSVEAAAREMQQTAIDFGKNKGKRIRHSILSFAQREHVTPEKANEFAQEIIQFYAPEYQIVYGVHENTDDLHIHFAMNQISFVDGHRYEGKRQDWHSFGDYMEEVTHLPIILTKSKECHKETE